MKKKKSTQEKIINAARSLFLQKGIDGTSVRDIALKAGINVALLNYHFRSKENLFDTIFEQVITKYSPTLIEVSNSDLPLEKKVYHFIDAYSDLLIKTPQLVTFILSVLHRHPDKMIKMKIFTKLYNTEIFSLQLIEEADKGNIKEVNPQHFFISIISLVAFPFAIRDIIIEKNDMDNKGFKAFINERKKLVYDMVMQSIKK